jgi:hypothetical protein
MCVFIFCTTISVMFLILRKNERDMINMYVGLHVCQILMKLVYSQKHFEKFSFIKLNENPSSKSRVVPCGQTDGQADMKKLIVALLNFAK